MIPGNLADRLERMAGIRNVLVHSYTDLGADERVHAALEDLDDIRRAVAELTEDLAS